ncbi:MAG: hypothetical protein LUC43_06155, partial [Burkholderiales bacterium]|nr:hypothetical protein [Burkholderiales bacterium]
IEFNTTTYKNSFMTGKILNYLYPATVTKNKDGSYKISFLDVPEAKTSATTQKELMGKAVNALVNSLNTYEKEHRKFPLPSGSSTSTLLVPMPLSSVSKIIALNRTIETNAEEKMKMKNELP